ncbi:MAG: class I tRNA ligase family protein, partial [Nitrosarchaeum sp.]|nr:class I tRNA ligase family protein [Nitrosarchaeum sp.]
MEPRYDPHIAEPRWQTAWKESGIYAFNEKGAGEIFSIDTPPPYASADHLHVGHAMHYSQFEFVARYKRMRGYRVFFPMGFDDNGLPTERYVEKKHKINKSKISRADFIKLCIEATQETGKTYLDLFTSLGFSVDWSLLYQTIDERSRRASQASFIDLYNKDRLVHTELPTMWDVTLQTTIAQADLESVDLKSIFNDIAFTCEGRQLTIATTRPELVPACVALCHHPEDERYTALTGKQAKVPLMDFTVPIIADPAVDKEKGTGLMMVCTFGDKEDIEKWHKHKLPLRIIITEDGKIRNEIPHIGGLSIAEARKQILTELKAAGSLLSQKDIIHAVQVSERSGAPIEYLVKPQWSIKVLDKKEELIAAGRKCSWYPDHMRIRYEHWIKNLNWDWGISRQRYYGVPFPVWYCSACGAITLPDIKDLPVDVREQQPKAACSCGSTQFRPEMDVMDTWMTSSVSHRINAKWTLHDE